MTIENYFTKNELVTKKKYDALREFFYEKKGAEYIAKKYDYKLSSFYSLTRDFKKHLKSGAKTDFFFQDKKPGRKHKGDEKLDNLIISLRKKNYSTKDILIILHSKSYQISYNYVYTLLKKEGFAKLPRRSADIKPESFKIEASKSKALELKA